MIAAIVIGVTVTGCSSARSHWSGPFNDPHAPSRILSFIRGHVAVGGIYDIMVPDFRNYSGSTVRVTSVRLVSPRNDVQVLGARAYPYSRIHGGTAVIDEGDLAKGCPGYYVQQPITDVVVKPKSISNWYVVIALKFLKPGNAYHFGVARIGYVTGGKEGWQYYRLPNAYLRTVSKRAYPQLYSPNVC
jgi:hypothetical protein